MSTSRTPPTTGPVLPRSVVILVAFAAAALVVTGMRGLSDIIGPAFLALVLAIGTQPIRVGLTRRGLPAWVGVVASLLTIYAGLVVFTVSMVVAVGQFATLLPSYQGQMEQLVQRGVDWLSGQGVGQDQIDRLTGEFDLGRVVSVAGNLVSELVAAASSLFLVVTLVLFMVVDASRFSDRLRRLPAGHDDWVAALTSFGSATRRYIVVSTVFGLIVAVLDTVALMWMGVPIALLWGLLAFITNYIPNIGFVLGVVPPAVIGLFEGGVPMMVGVLVVYSVLNVVVQTIIQPKIVGDAVGLSTTLTMLSLVFWALTLGTMGALLAVPLTLFVKALLVDADPRSRWLNPLLTGEHPFREKGARRVRRPPRAPAARPPAEAR
ncbi:MAG TPA: AI-2E family transporter [Nocardioidaceae bacterium]